MLEREIRQLDQAASKVKAEVKKLAAKGDVRNAKVLAREVVRSNKQKDRLHTSQARLNSIGMQLNHQLGASVWVQGDGYGTLMETLQPRSRSRARCRSRPRS